ncbi:MAG: hypothetical protein HRU20_21700 [Pseudomonadales bacterium]|nr:hypothetical protein [Pseudomonadales bacterium]
MKSSRLLPCLLILMLSACSTYKTNSDISFRSTELSGLNPVLPVGQKVPADMVTYLGWVEAKVSSPSVFHEPPTQAQVDIVLAEKAKQLGADVVIHVDYKKRVNGLSLGKLTARGQAVRINAWHIGEADPAVVVKENLYRENRESELELLINPVVLSTPPTMSNTLIASSAQHISLDSNNHPQPTNTDNTNEISSLKAMLREAQLLKDYAKRNKDKAAYKAATKLEHLIEDHLIEYSNSFD